MGKLLSWWGGESKFWDGSATLVSSLEESIGKPAIYHVINRVVDRRFVFGAEEKEKFRMFMRLIESLKRQTN